MTDKDFSSAAEPKPGQTVRDGLRQTDFRRSLRREIIELKEFMLTTERREQLDRMGRLKRWLVVPLWLFRSLLQKLAPVRRLLVVVGLWLSIFYRSGTNRDPNYSLLGIFVLLFVLLLELKDKLLAHEELEAGHAVQKALMPTSTPKVTGWNLWLFTRSANEVGGDLLDFIPIDDSRFGIALGDVAGKGLRAALLTARLQASLRALISDFNSLGELCERINRIYCRDTLRQIFSSLAYLEIRPQSGMIRMVNAGHLPPLLARGAKVEKLEKGGLALGLSAEATYCERWLELQKGDWLLVYSDGLTDAQNVLGDFFGEERLLALMPQLSDLLAVEIGERLVTSIDRFIGDARVHDDLSIAVLKRDEPQAKEE